MQNINRYLRGSLLAVLSGILAGGTAAAFLFLLDLVTKTREAHPIIIGLLPIAGFFVGWVYYRYGRDVAAGHNLILDEIHDPKKVTPSRMAPFVLFGTMMTHLFGGSAGREGAAVQMSASLSDQLTRFIKVSKEERKTLLVCGVGAGFGAAIGAPWAGVIFGMEVLQVGELRLFAFVESTIACFVAYAATWIFHNSESLYPYIDVPLFDGRSLALILIAGIGFGLAARIFIFTTHMVERALNGFIKYPPLKPALAGGVLVLLYYWEGSYRYDGLGIPIIQESLRSLVNVNDPLYKTLFTALTVGSGFKGGEFVPLVFIGATLGNIMSLLIPVAIPVLAATGFAAVFAGAANTPIAASIMAMEIFGPHIGLYALAACLMSYLVSGSRGIYKSQKHERPKPQALWATLKGLKNIF